jgi:hypothetical protein
MRDRADAPTLPLGHYEQDSTDLKTSHHTPSPDSAPKSRTDSGAFFSFD